jgi:hypothetical protein
MCVMRQHEREGEGGEREATGERCNKKERRE